MCHSHATPAAARHGQRRFGGWISGWRAGCCACSTHGTALEDGPRVAAGHHCATVCQQGLVGGWPKQRRFGRRQPKRRLDQRGPRQYAECHRLGRVQPGGRSFACDAVVRDGGLWGAVGRSGRPLEGQQGSCGRGEDQDGDEPRCQPRLQPLTSMRPRTHRHPGSPPAATGGRPIAAPVGGRRAWSRPGAASSSMNRGSDRACPPIRRAGPISARRRRSAASRCDSPLRQLRVYSP